jgi:hypothetical protein
VYLLYFTFSLMLTFCYSAALLQSIPLASMSHPSPPDSSAVAARPHLLTGHTLHLGSPFIPAAGYEAIVRPRWGLRASLGGRHASKRYTYSSTDSNGRTAIGTTEFRFTDLLVDASLNYYLQSRKPSLTGWFVGVGLITAFNHTRIAEDNPAYRSHTHQEVGARPTLRAGRHWALGPRWLLDTHVAVAIWADPARVVFLKEFIGLGAGYRF